MRTTLKQAGALCAKWLGKDPGQSVPCRSTAVGRSLELKVPGRVKQSYAIESCAVPRPTVRPSKRCKTAFLGRADGGMFPGAITYIDGGKVRNAQRTPRPFHPAIEVEWVAGHMVGGPADLIDANYRAGNDLLEGLDLPFPHRAGSSPCCPTSAISVVVLREDVRAAMEADELWPSLRTRLAKLSKHLAGPRHDIKGLPAMVAADDFAGATAIVDAGARSCERYLSSWQANAEESLKLRKVEKKKERSRKASKKRRDSKARSEGGRKAVMALQRQSRTGRKLSALKPAGVVLGVGSIVEVRHAASNPDDRWTYTTGKIERISGSDALVVIGREEVFIPLRRLKAAGAISVAGSKPLKLRKVVAGYYEATANGVVYEIRNIGGDTAGREGWTWTSGLLGGDDVFRSKRQAVDALEDWIRTHESPRLKMFRAQKARREALGIKVLDSF